MKPLICAETYVNSKIERFGRELFVLVENSRIGKQHSLPKKNYTNESLGSYIIYK